ncbi:SDR family NAD(P)-dependent oxidoreductase [Actinoplanes sp. LDG1-06]|uniref:SDR family NAD(P)-dependent oxidoreductase n=1 Tax=Paractinoplanes ovalisporus TaxID=2810368 RepID=A0ABS2AP12_9ACTN|nr:SDR family NAD(P)-dependent oxidoreductase [Actinoplanes ovalisporus]MBM2621549.1 SDR family NAD(P)-dependent oxidoreductase [Actinoplanes ovalisporus]
MTARTVVITGASDGIGAAAARQLAANGHRVVVVGRSEKKTRAVAESIGTEWFRADFTRLDDVRKLALDLNAACARIDVLANNAGGIFGAAKRTGDGFETTFQINHLAPFLLTKLLLDKLIASRATVIQTASVGARLAPRIDLDDLNMERRFESMRAYSASKLENILFTRELHRRYHDRGLNAVAIHPGNVASGFGAGTDNRLVRVIATNRLFRRYVLTTPEKGADQLVWLSEARPGVDWQPGGYYEKRKPARTSAQAADADLARGLWERSDAMAG